MERYIDQIHLSELTQTDANSLRWLEKDRECDDVCPNDITNHLTYNWHQLVNPKWWSSWRRRCSNRLCHCSEETVDEKTILDGGNEVKGDKLHSSHLHHQSSFLYRDLEKYNRMSQNN